MGTRADFYIGRGDQAEWLGSIALDGNPGGVIDDGPKGNRLLGAQTADAFRSGVRDYVSNRDDGTLPEQGWPWPWEDSRTTDYAYAHDGGTLYASCFGHEWFRVDPGLDNYGEDVDEEWDETRRTATFPDMTNRKNVTHGTRSGVIVFGDGRFIPAAEVDREEAVRPSSN